MTTYPFRRCLLPALNGALLFSMLALSSKVHAIAVSVSTGAQIQDARCDYLVVSDSVLATQARRLADLRHSLTPAVAAQPCVAMMADVYRNYPPRGPKWTSLQDFLKATQGLSTRALAHVTLLGDASFEENSQHNIVPTFSQQIPSLDRSSRDTLYFDTLSSDDAFSVFFDSLAYGSQLNSAFAIGRIPARTVAQADAYLDKVEAYEADFHYGPHAFTHAFLSDDDLQLGGFRDGLEPITHLPELHQQLWDALPVKPFVRRMLSIEFPIQADTTKPAAKDSTLGIFNAGPGRIYFIGHGESHQLTDEKIFEVPADLTRLRAKPLQPIVSMLACTTARFAAPDSASMGEQLLFHPHGAVAFLGGTIPTYPFPNNDLFIHWDSLAMEGGTVGGSFARAKHKAYDGRNSSAYAVLGDPALTLRVPAFNLSPAIGSGADKVILQNAGAPGDSAYFQLVRIDSIPFNPIIHPENQAQRDRFYPREVVLADGRAALAAGGSVTFALPYVGDPRRAAVKIMTWNSRGMRYGHFTMEELGVTALRPQAARGLKKDSPRLVVWGNGLVVEGFGRRVGLDGREVR